MVTDLNKNITGTTELNTTGSITYNHLNLPASIAIEGKGTIEYIYDALGIKLQKRVTEGNNLNATDYIDGVIYNNDTLQFFVHE